MSATQVKYSLLLIFVMALAVELGCLISAKERMWPEDLNSLIMKVLTIYSVQLGVVLGGIFSKTDSSSANPGRALSWTALGLAALWNALLLWRVVSFSFAQQDSANDLKAYLDSVGSGAAFLVAGVLTYFFGKSSSQPAG